MANLTHLTTTSISSCQTTWDGNRVSSSVPCLLDCPHASASASACSKLGSAWYMAMTNMRHVKWIRNEHWVYNCHAKKGHWIEQTTRALQSKLWPPCRIVYHSYHCSVKGFLKIANKTASWIWNLVLPSKGYVIFGKLYSLLGERPLYLKGPVLPSQYLKSLCSPWLPAQEAFLSVLSPALSGRAPGEGVHTS